MCDIRSFHFWKLDEKCNTLNEHLLIYGLMMAYTAEACSVQRVTDAEFETKMDCIVVCALWMNDSVPTANYTMTLCSIFLKIADH